ncbi:MAG: hypothetical protein HGA22_12130 [Clostridiales bacterium]|nr:hypothetical protein [Clostridiales bacterium]
MMKKVVMVAFGVFLLAFVLLGIINIYLEKEDRIVGTGVEIDSKEMNNIDTGTNTCTETNTHTGTNTCTGTNTYTEQQTLRDLSKDVLEYVSTSSQIEMHIGNHTEMDVSDYHENMAAVIEEADLIILGKVDRNECYSNISVISAVKVSETIKGPIFNEVIIFQLGGSTLDEEILKEGKEYLLLLGKQTDEKENTFYLKGGCQGDLLIADGKVIAGDSVMSGDIKAVVEKNKTDKSDNEKLIEYFYEKTKKD